MQVIPALDIREGACVQLVGGSYAEERVRIDDPVSVARQWESSGFTRLHVVDLDAATRRRSNRGIIRDIIAATRMTVQCGGGIRDCDAIEDMLRSGAAAVVLGTRALEDRPWLTEAATRFPGKIIVAADVRQRRVVTRGWEEELPVDVMDAVRQLKDLPLAAVLVTAVHREGRMEGPDCALMRDIIAVATHPVQASGGIRSVADLRELQQTGVGSAIVGMALYTGVLEVETVTREYAK